VDGGLRVLRRPRRSTPAQHLSADENPRFR
jgi:hypothetical protein